MLPYLSMGPYITVYLYPLMMGIAWAVGYLIVKDLNEQIGNPYKNLKSYFIGLFITSWLGAKSFFLLTTNFEKSVALESSFWLGGGLVFYGGLVFGLIFTFIYIKRYNVTLNQLSILIPALAIGHGIGRIGCFFAGCCYGEVFDALWSVKLHGLHRHPVQIYESLFLLIIGGHFWKKVKRTKDLNISLWCHYLIIYSLLRFMTEQFRGDTIRGLWNWGLSSSQIVSIIILIIVYFYMRKLKVTFH